jgi:hypothetical protein
MKSSEKATYSKSYHSQPPRAIRRTPFPAVDPPNFWWRSPAAGASGGGGGVCGLGSVGGGGVVGCHVVGGTGGICCSGEGHRASSGLPSGCWRCGGGGGALLCLSASAVFWRLGASSPMKEPSPRWSLRDLDPSAWLLHAGAAPCASSSSGSGRHPRCPCGGAPAPAPYLFPSRRGLDLRDLAPRDLGWRAAGGRVRHRGCDSCDWGRLPAAGPPGHPRRGSASTPGPTTATPGPRTGPCVGSLDQ